MQHSKLTIVSMAVIASALATLLHEGIGHGVLAWLRGDIPTELTSNHLSSLRADLWVDAGGTLVNFIAGVCSLAASRIARDRANLRYFLWVLAALNLLPAAGYFMLSGIFAFGDLYELIRGAAHESIMRGVMTLVGAGLYVSIVWRLAAAIHPFATDASAYNTVGRLPYYAAGLFSCVAGAFDPLGLKLLFVSTIPAAFGGSSGLLWADRLLPRGPVERKLTIARQPVWWVAAAVLGTCYVAILGPGVQLAH